MYLKVGMICLLSLMGTCVKGYEEFECEEYPLKQNDPFSPAQTVRVCGTGEYEDIPKLLRTLFGIEKPIVEKPAQYLLPPFEKPASTPKFSNGFSQNVVQPHWESGHLPSYIESKQQYPTLLHSFYYDIDQRPTEGDLIDFHAIDERKQQQANEHLDGIVDDVRAVKQSVYELKELFKNILTAKRNVEKRERNINITLTVDTTLELLAKRILQLAEERTKGEETDELNAAFSSMPSDANLAHIEDDDEEEEHFDKDVLDSLNANNFPSQKEKISADVEDDDDNDSAYAEDDYALGVIDADKVDFWLQNAAAFI